MADLVTSEQWQGCYQFCLLLPNCQILTDFLGICLQDIHLMAFQQMVSVCQTEIYLHGLHIRDQSAHILLGAHWYEKCLLCSRHTQERKREYKLISIHEKERHLCSFAVCNKNLGVLQKSTREEFSGFIFYTKWVLTI